MKRDNFPETSPEIETGGEEDLLVCLSCGSVFKREEAKSRNLPVKICKNCGHKYDSDDVYLCSKCGGTKFLHMVKFIRICPDCDSSKIIRLPEFERIIERECRNISAKSEKILAVFNKIAREFNRMKHLLMEARKDGFHHFPFVENRLIDFSSKFDGYKQKFAQRLLKLADELKLVETTPKNPHGIATSTIEALKRAKKHLQELEEELAHVQRELSDELFDIYIPIHSLHYSDTVFRKFRRFVRLAASERPVSAFEKIVITRPDGARRPCVLFLTNLRVIGLETGDDDFFEKFYEERLENISAVEEGGVLRKYLLLKTSNGEVKFQGDADTLRFLRRYLKIAQNYEHYSAGNSKVEVLKEICISTEDFEDVLTKFRTSVFRIVRILRESRRQEKRGTESIIKEVHAQPSKHDEKKKYSEARKKELLSLLEELERKFREGLISTEEYFKYYRAWIRELYSLLHSS